MPWTRWGQRPQTRQIRHSTQDHPGQGRGTTRGEYRACRVNSVDRGVRQQVGGQRRVEAAEKIGPLARRGDGGGATVVATREALDGEDMDVRTSQGRDGIEHVLARRYLVLGQRQPGAASGADVERGHGKNGLPGSNRGVPTVPGTPPADRCPRDAAQAAPTPGHPARCRVPSRSRTDGPPMAGLLACGCGALRLRVPCLPSRGVAQWRSDRDLTAYSCGDSAGVGPASLLTLRNHLCLAVRKDHRNTV